ncbi:MAG: M1 family aminopeptidase [Candidatus Bipolaricaulota bacterium]|nr:M1 family aminopeptidase [Candidatus Bipolaricaulota bacterium]
MARRVSLVVSLLLGLVAAIQAHELPRYLLKVQLDPHERLLFGTATVDYHNDSSESLSSVYFLLFPNYAREPNPHLDPAVTDGSYWYGFDPAKLEINSVKSAEGADLPFALETGPDMFQTYSLQETLLRVDLPAPLAPGETVRIVIDFDLKFPHVAGPDEGFSQETFTWRFGWYPVPVPASELIQGRYDKSDRPYFKYLLPNYLYELELNLPQEYVVAAGLDFQTEEVLQNQKGQKLVRVRSDIPVRSVPFSISKEYRVYQFKSEIPITVYYRPGNEANARLIATYAQEILADYQEHFGPYTYKRLVIVESVSDGYFGMAADAFIILGNSFFYEKDLGVAGMLDRLTEYVLAHEIAHQWWGIGIGADLNAENFLSEAFSDYLSITYFEKRYGEFGPNLIKIEREGLLERFIKSQLGYLNLRQHLSELPYVLAVKDRFDEAIVKPQQDVQYANYSAVRLYNKGYLVLRALRSLIGQEKLHEVLRAAKERFGHAIISVAEFQRLTEEISQKDLKSFFETWLYQDNPAPTLDYRVTNVVQEKLEQPTASGERYRVRVHLERHGPAGLPATVVAVTDSGQEFTYIYESERPQETWEFLSPQTIKETRVDPQSLLPDINRLNNYYPQRTRIITNGDNDMPLDAYLIRLNPTTQTIEGGFLNDHRWVMANGYFAGTLNLGRGASVTAAVSAMGDVFGFVNLSWVTFAHPNVGYRGVFWVPQERFSLTVARLADLPEGPQGPLVPVAFLGADYQRSDSWRWLYTIGISLRQGFDFTQLSVAGVKRLRLWPNIYWDVGGTVGGGLNTRGGFLFDLSALSSYRGVKGFPFADRFRWLVYSEVFFPLQRAMRYSVLNLGLLNQIDLGVYLLAGRTAPTLEALWSTAGAKIEVGAEVRLQGRALSGLLPVTLLLRLGYAVTQNSEGRVTLSVGVSFSNYARALSLAK